MMTASLQLLVTGHTLIITLSIYPKVQVTISYTAVVFWILLFLAIILTYII